MAALTAAASDPSVVVASVIGAVGAVAAAVIAAVALIQVAKSNTKVSALQGQVQKVHVLVNNQLDQVMTRLERVTRERDSLDPNKPEIP
jgi:hypothetical protein